MIETVSIIIPTFKRSEYLGRAIESVLNQTYTNIELIVVDDNDEGTVYRKENEKIMHKYKDRANVIYVKHKKNLNGAAARNTGIRVSTGKYITFLDDDDFFLKDRIGKMVKILEDNRHYDCAYSSMVYLKDGKIIGYKKAEKRGNLRFEVLSQDSFFGTGSNLFLRRTAVERTGFFDEKFSRHQDIEYMVRFFREHDVINVDDILVVKTVDDNQNIPEYARMRDVKELFFATFKKDIEGFSTKKQQYIYFKNYYELITFAKFKSDVYREIRKKILTLKLVEKEAWRRIFSYEIKKKFLISRIAANIKSAMNRKKDVKSISPEKMEEIYDIYYEKNGGVR